MKQAIAGVAPAHIEETEVATVWPSVASFGIGRVLGRFFEIRWPNVAFFRLGNLIALLAAPLAAGLYLLRLHPSIYDVSPHGVSYRVTNRRVQVLRNELVWGPVLLKGALGGILGAFVGFWVIGLALGVLWPILAVNGLWFWVCIGLILAGVLGGAAYAFERGLSPFAALGVVGLSIVGEITAIVLVLASVMLPQYIQAWWGGAPLAEVPVAWPTGAIAAFAAGLFVRVVSLGGGAAGFFLGSAKFLFEQEQKSVQLDKFDEIDVEVQPGQAWYHAGDLVFRQGNTETFRLVGVSRPKAFRETCLKSRAAFVGVKKAVERELAHA